MRRGLFIVLIAVTAGIGLVAAGWHARGGPGDAVTAKARPLEAGALPAQVVAKALGRIEASSEEIGVSSDLTGRIAEILVEEGDTVEKGAPLVRLEPFVYQSKVEAAKAAVAQAVARRKLLLAGARAEEIEVVQKLLEETQASERLARSSWERTQQLLEAGLIAESAADSAREEKEAAAARVKGAMERLLWVRNQTRKEELEAADAEVAQRTHELAVAEAELDKTVLRAPIAGTVVRKLMRVGEAVSSLQVEPVIRIADMTDLRVRSEVDEIDVSRVRLDQRVELEVLARPGKTLRGKVLRIGKVMGRKRIESNDPNAREDVRILEVLSSIDEPADLPLGYRVTVSFLD